MWIEHYEKYWGVEMEHDASVLPVLLLIFNRVDTAEKVISALRKIKPKRIYISSDGPRLMRGGGTDEDVYRAREVVKQIDWPCEIKTLFREKNLGCRLAVSSGIDWFFEYEDYGIILEDDCIPDPSYFRFCYEMLLKYKDDHRVMVVGANHFAGSNHNISTSYFFSRYNHCWGWASWRRAWKFYDRNMERWPSLKETDWLLSVGNGNKNFQSYWTDIFEKAYSGKIDSWAYRWTFSCWTQNALTILPNANLVKNIGFNDGATHTKTGPHAKINMKLESLEFPLNHPTVMVRDFFSDSWTDKNYFHIGSRWIAFKAFMIRILETLGLRKNL